MLKRLSLLLLLLLNVSSFAMFQPQDDDSDDSEAEQILMQLLSSQSGMNITLPAKFDTGQITLEASEIPPEFIKKMAVLNVNGPNSTAIKLYVWEMKGFSCKYSVASNSLYNNAFTLVYDGKDPNAKLVLQLVNELPAPNTIYAKVNLMDLK